MKSIVKNHRKGEMMYKKYELENGIRIVAEKMPYYRSVSVGLWFQVGSVFEKCEDNGMSHFIEHMLFKGTKTRTAKQIAQEMDAVGGHLNAFTGKECTCYYSKIVDEHLPKALDILADMLLNSLMDPMELEKEKGVILEEILMYEDSPEDLASDLLAKALFQQHPLGNPILGNQQFLSNLTRGNLVSFLEEKYTPHNLVISLAGNFDEKMLLDNINQLFGYWKKDTGAKKFIPKPDYAHQNLFKWKDIEQVHLCIGYPSISLGHDETYPLLMFNNLFGGSMSSRLFQKIREDRGLAYSVMSYPSFYTCGGLFTIYACMKPTQARQVMDLIIEEAEQIKNHGISEYEFNTAKEQLKGSYVLGLEGTGNRMNVIGRSEILLGKIRTPSEVLEKIENTTIDDVINTAYNIFNDSHRAIAVVGRENILETGTVA